MSYTSAATPSHTSTVSSELHSLASYVVDLTIAYALARNRFFDRTVVSLLPRRQSKSVEKERGWERSVVPMATRTEVSSNHQSHGVKRTAPDTLEHEQRLAKRFDLLNIENSGKKRYIPVAADRSLPNANRDVAPSTTRAEDDIMQVDDTPHKVYIHDLDKELAEIESDEENPIFLVDIEKHLNRLPQHLLRSPDELKPTTHNQMILYSVPSSISLPEEQDQVRKAIEEARERLKARQALSPHEFAMEEGSAAPTAGRITETNRDADAMDVEDDL